MSAWTKFATQFFHNKQKQNPDYKFSQALKEASKVYKKTKGGSSKNCGGAEGEEVKMYKIQNNDNIVDCIANANGTYADDCKTLDNIKLDINNMKDNTDLKETFETLAKKFNSLPGVTDEMKFVLNDEVITQDTTSKINTDEQNINAAMENSDNNLNPIVVTDGNNNMLLGDSNGGKKSKRKSKKAGKKSQKKQKKAKKAGSKKCKK
jgi:hypothetical protein